MADNLELKFYRPVEGMNRHELVLLQVPALFNFSARRRQASNLLPKLGPAEHVSALTDYADLDDTWHPCSNGLAILLAGVASTTAFTFRLYAPTNLTEV